MTVLEVRCPLCRRVRKAVCGAYPGNGYPVETWMEWPENRNAADDPEQYIICPECAGAENGRLREALEFYADICKYDRSLRAWDDLQADEGEVARKALGMQPCRNAQNDKGE